MTRRKNEQDVLMILPKKTIHAPAKLPDAWTLDQDPGGLSLFIDRMPVALAGFWDESDFGNSRPAIHFTCQESSLAAKIFELLVSRLSFVYERTPSRNPLYIRFSQEQTDLIAAASRMGFIPYFGEWTLSNADHSVACWQSVTERLKQRYPNGFKAG